MEFYKNRIELKYFLNADNKIFDIKYAGFDFLDDLTYPKYFVFDCKYEYYHHKLKYYCNDEIVEEFLDLSIKINLYSNFGSYYIKFSDLFSCFNNSLMISMNFNDYSELKLYEFYRDIEDLSKYFEINFGLKVIKD